MGRERAAYAKSVTGATRPRSLDASPGVAVQGADDTLAALAAGQVETLLITGTAHGRAWFGAQAVCAARPATTGGCAAATWSTSRYAPPC